MTNLIGIVVLPLALVFAWTEKTEYENEACICACPFDYLPVCSVDNATQELRTFCNECSLDCENKCWNGTYVILSQGECDEDITPEAEEADGTQTS